MWITFLRRDGRDLLGQKDRCRLILLDQNGQSVRLTPVDYEFSDVNEVTADWIVIDAEITSDNGDWRFRDASLLAVECVELGSWLSEAAESQVPTTGPDEDPALTFIEPSLGFSVASYGDRTVNLRVHLSHLAAPPWQDIDDKLNTWTFFVELLIGLNDVRSAASSWNREAAAFPPRTQRW